MDNFDKKQKLKIFDKEQQQKTHSNSDSPLQKPWKLISHFLLNTSGDWSVPLCEETGFNVGCFRGQKVICCTDTKSTQKLPFQDPIEHMVLSFLLPWQLSNDPLNILMIHYHLLNFLGSDNENHLDFETYHQILPGKLFSGSWLFFGCQSTGWFTWNWQCCTNLYCLGGLNLLLAFLCDLVSIADPSLWDYQCWPHNCPYWPVSFSLYH